MYAPVVTVRGVEANLGLSEAPQAERSIGLHLFEQLVVLQEEGSVLRPSIGDDNAPRQIYPIIEIASVSPRVRHNTDPLRFQGVQTHERKHISCSKTVCPLPPEYTPGTAEEGCKKADLFSSMSIRSLFRCRLALCPACSRRRFRQSNVPWSSRIYH